VSTHRFEHWAKFPPRHCKKKISVVSANNTEPLRVAVVGKSEIAVTVGEQVGFHCSVNRNTSDLVHFTFEWMHVTNAHDDDVPTERLLLSKTLQGSEEESTFGGDFQDTRLFSSNVRLHDDDGTTSTSIWLVHGECVCVCWCGRESGGCIGGWEDGWTAERKSVCMREGEGQCVCVGR
jgi:hypothetical protein